MNKTLRLGLVILIIGTTVVGILGLCIWFSRDAIKQYAIKQLNTQLTAPVSVSQIDISFIKQFPKVSLKLSNVSIADPLRLKQTLFEAQEVYIAFNIYDVLTKDYKVKLIAADSGKCSIFINHKGETNYTIFKQDTLSEEDLLLSLTEIKLHNIKIEYESLADKQLYIAEAVDVKLSGNIRSKREDIDCSGSFDIEKVKSGNTTYIKNKNVFVDIALAIDEKQLVYAIKKADLAIGTLKLKLNGQFKLESKNTYTDLSFSAPQMAIIDLLEILPGDLSKYVIDYKSEGNIYLNGDVKGNSKSGLTTHIVFGIDKGKLTPPIANGISLENINCKGEWVMERNMQKAFVKLPELHFTLGKEAINAALVLYNFDEPRLDLKINGDVSTEDLLKFVKAKEIQKCIGSIKFDATIQGLLSELSSKSGFAQSSANGHFSCVLKELILTAYSSIPINNVQADFTLNNQHLDIQTLKAEVGESDLTASGMLSNFVPYLFSDKEHVAVQMILESNKLNVKNMIFPFTASNNAEQKAFELPKRVEVNASVSIGTLVFNEFKGESVSGKITWRGHLIEAEALKARAMGGAIKCDGSIENVSDGRFLVSAKVQTDKVDLSEAFRQCQNFGQAEITHQNLKGQLTTNMEVVGVWSSTLVCDLDRLFASGKVTITQGQLLNYAPLESLSKFIDVQDLRTLKFADLHNTIEVVNKTITIPAMRVSNNALNLEIYGTHTFSNYMDYHFKVKLNELLAKKYKLSHSEYEEETMENGTNLFIGMKGTPDNLKFSYDKKQARKQVINDLKTEREDVKKLWRKELGIEKDETIKEKKNDGEELEFEVE